VTNATNCGPDRPHSTDARRNYSARPSDCAGSTHLSAIRAHQELLKGHEKELEAFHETLGAFHERFGPLGQKRQGDED
jgi:hypothetical protein